MNSRSKQNDGGALTRMGMALSDWAERWFPDALVFAMLAIVVVFVAGLSVGSTASELVTDFGDGFWELVPFTMQMAMIVIGGYVVANTRCPDHAVAGLDSSYTTRGGGFRGLGFHDHSLLSWGFSLIFSALLVRQIVQRVRGGTTVPRGVSLSRRRQRVGSWVFLFCRLLMASSGSIPPELLRISGRIPLTQTIFTWQSELTALIIIAVSVGVAYLSAPAASAAKTAEALGVTIVDSSTAG